jgi:hypothetical protein
MAWQVWYGMVWYGMVWYGMVWYGMVWYGMVWYGMAWYYGMPWCSMADIAWPASQSTSPVSTLAACNFRLIVVGGCDV